MNDSYLTYLSGKSVALVGGDDDIDWDRVNAADVVVRVNSHWRRQRGRIDVLYYSCARDLGLEIFSEPDFIDSPPVWLWLNAAHVLFTEDAGTMPEIIDIAEERNIPWDYYWHAPGDAFQVFAVLRQVSSARAWTREFAERYRFHPLTGVLALHHVTLSDAREIYVTGMSLYRKADGTLPASAGMHDILPQLSYLRDVKRDDSRILFGAGLLDILD